jgi:hypothetical protein
MVKGVVGADRAASGLGRGGAVRAVKLGRYRHRDGLLGGGAARDNPSLLAPSRIQEGKSGGEIHRPLLVLAGSAGPAAGRSTTT